MDDISSSEQVLLTPEQDFPSDQQEEPHHPMTSTITTMMGTTTNNRGITSSGEEEGEDAEVGVLLPPRRVDMGEWNRQIDRAQRVSLFSAHALAIVLLIVTGQWVSQLGGLSWEKGQAKLIFNWHPLLMILAFCFMTVASLSFRYRHFHSSRSASKLLHGVGWAIGAGCMAVGLAAAFFSHNDRTSGFVANMYSLHSWVGMTVLSMYSVQFLVGIGAFVLPHHHAFGISEISKAKIVQVHSFFGPVLYLSMMLTILLGIQEKEGFVGCGYKVDAPDMIPFQNFSQIPFVCKQSHAMGFCILAMGLCTMFALHQMDRTKYRTR